MDNCLFCKIVKREIPAKVVYEDNDVIAFLDIFPFEKGHTLIIPKEHYENLLDIDSEILSKIIKVSQKLAKEYEKKLNCGFNLTNNCKKIAGQEIYHFHMHLIPRTENKRFYCLENKSNYESEEELDKYYQTLKLN